VLLLVTGSFKSQRGYSLGLHSGEDSGQGLFGCDTVMMW